MGNRPGRRVGSGRQSRSGLALPYTVVAVALVIILIGAAWLTGIVEYSFWWLTNSTPPTVAVEAPATVLRGSVNAVVRVMPGDRARTVEATVDGRPLQAGDVLSIDTTVLPDGPHQLTVVAEDRSWRKNRATATATLITDNTPPRLSLESQPPRVSQGHTWILRIRTNEPASVEARIGDRPLTVEAANGFGWAVVGFGPTSETADLPVVVDGRDPAGNVAEEHDHVVVAAEDFPLDAVDVPPALAALLAGEIRTEEDKRLAERYQRSSGEKLWEGRFTLPITGPVITEFGTRRTYNNGPIVGHHQGMDIAAPQGRPVLAPARGRVVGVEEVRLRGRIIVLDHGLGVYTLYAHLSSQDVQVGQMVERGQAIGKVGTTGLSTGPHLHWELWVGGQNVNPVEWTERDLP